MEEILKAYLNDGTAEIVTQIQFIINQINSSDDLILHDSDDDNEETDDDEVKFFWEILCLKERSLKFSKKRNIGEKLYIFENILSNLCKEKTCFFEYFNITFFLSSTFYLS